METYVALLRGVNVAGARKVPMAELREAVGALGHEDVRTYVQSGNVLLRSSAPARSIGPGIEDALRDALDVEATVVVLTAAELCGVVEGNPFIDRGIDPKLLAAALLAGEPAPAKVEELTAGDYGREELEVRGTTVYLHLPDGQGRAKLSHALLERRLGVPVTARNWRTMTTLLDMARQRG